MTNPAYHVVNLSDMKLFTHNSLWYLTIPLGGKEWHFHVGRSFKATFCRMFNVSRRTTDNIPLDAVVRAVLEGGDKKVKIYVDNSAAAAIALMRENTVPVDVNQAVSIYDSVKDDHEVLEFFQDEMCTEFIIFNPNKFRLFDGKHGLYRIGGLVHIKHWNGANIKAIAVLEHCSSGNYAIINNRALSVIVPVRNEPSWAMRSTVHSLHMIATAKRPEFYDLLANRLVALRNTTASIRECIRASSIVSEIDIFRARTVNLNRICDHYDIASPDEKNEKWLERTPSHADRLQLFHLMIDTVVVDFDNRRDYTEKVGRVLF